MSAGTLEPRALDPGFGRWAGGGRAGGGGQTETSSKSGRSHSGRRWFATELISKGVDLKAVSVLMGHSSVAMTAQYAEDNPQRLRRIAAELG